MCVYMCRPYIEVSIVKYEYNSLVSTGHMKIALQATRVMNVRADEEQLATVKILLAY